MVALHLLICFIMEDLKVFNNEEFGQLRTVSNENGEPMFCMVDVAVILGIKNPRVKDFSFNPKGVGLTLTPTEGGEQEMTFIDERNLYRMIFRSRKEWAVKFQDWVFDEVLPSIRRTGTYTLPAATEMFPLYQDVLLSQYSGKRRERVLVLMEKLSPLVPSFPKGEWHIFNDDIDAIWYSKGYENMQPRTLVNLCVEAMRMLGYKVENRGIHWRILP